MVPFSGQADLLLQVDLNYGTSPSFSPGGIQVRAGIGEDCFEQARVLSGLRLEHASATETTRHTQLFIGSAFEYLMSG